MTTRNKIIAGLLALVLFSCGETPHYEKAYSFDNKEWKQDAKLKYEVDIKDIDKEYDFTLTVRTTTDYKYNNLWVFMKTIAPDGSTGREPFEIMISNPDGSWVGNKTGTVVETPLYFRKRKLPMKGKYTFILEQGITESKVDEILDMILTVDFAKKEQED
jgi:gliding motility-associated lipoprotein GldH